VVELSLDIESGEGLGKSGEGKVTRLELFANGVLEMDELLIAMIRAAA
jgi:hypothetical protein